MLKSGFFKKNRKLIADEMENNSALVLFAGKAPHQSADENYPFCVNYNFYYHCGINEENVVLVIKKINENIFEQLFLNRYDPVMAKWVAKPITAKMAYCISGIDQFRYVDELDAYCSEMFCSEKISTVYLDLFRNDENDSDSQAHIFEKKLNSAYKDLKIENIYEKISLRRTIKTDEEVKLIKTAIKHTKAGIKRMMTASYVGMNEAELLAHFMFELKKRMCGSSFNPVIASGKNGTTLHYAANNQKIIDGDIVLIDLGMKHNHYCADISRTFPINGKFTDRQRLLYNIVLETQRAVIEAVRPNVTLVELNNLCKMELAVRLKEVGIIHDFGELVEYYYHGVSHHLGMDAHDGRHHNLKLQPGMIITVEPGLYIEEEKIGIRLEDNILVTADGYENLSKSIPIEPDDVERFMVK